MTRYNTGVVPARRTGGFSPLLLPPVCHWLRQCSSRSCTAVAFTLLIAVILVNPATAQQSLLERARNHISKSPTPRNYLALAVLESTEPGGKKLTIAIPDGLNGPDAVALYEWLCWQSIPLTATETQRFEQRIANLRKMVAAQTPTGATIPGQWLPLFDLYRAHKAGDRKAQAAAATTLTRTIDTWPTAAADAALFDLLRELGLSRTQAGVYVISQRRHDSLFALADIDRGLTREADYFRNAGRPADATTLIACRDRLRESYLAASKQLVPRLFALKLLGQEAERRKLSDDARALTYLHDVSALGKALGQVDDEQAWTQLIEPLLQNELAAVAAPPKLSPQAGTAPDGPELTVQATSKNTDSQGIRYEGRVRVTWGEFRLTCDKLTVTGQDAAKFGFSASGNVEAEGLFGRVTVQQAQFDAARRKFRFTGRVRLQPRGKNDAQMAELLEIGPAGAVVRQNNLLDEFHRVQTHDERMALLPRITAAYADNELPDDVRYLLALSLLKPHLSWHVGQYDIPEPGALREAQKKELIALYDAEGLTDAWCWEEAHAGEEWMRADQKQRLAAEWLQQQQAINAKDKQPGRNVRKSETPPVFWRLKEPAAPEITRAKALLVSIKEPNYAAKARHWIAELKRNNTMLTFDILGGYARGKNGPVVLDCRGAEAVTMKVYRVRDPKQLLAATKRIGRDYMYRDYGLQAEEKVQHAADFAQLDVFHSARVLQRKRAEKVPVLNEADLVTTWQVRPAELPRVPNHRGRWNGRDHWDDDYADDGDDERFDDRCEWFRDRIEKAYRRDAAFAPTTWRSDRVVRVPAEALKEQGAYILVGEANGQRAYAPLLVEPLSLTLRRCRDGVFALVSDAEGFAPAAGASVIASEQFGQSWTDQGGAAFVRVVAAGDRSIIAVKDGRYAIGGFGDLFEGIYDTWDAQQDRMMRPLRKEVARRLRERRDEQLQAAQIYADDHLVAAYTDQPTYRPGQMANFKLIVRLIHRDRDEKPDASRPFRAEDFDLAASLRLPAPNTEIRYEVVNPKGRAVEAGMLNLNEFGTAAGSFPISPESAVGNYSLRVWLNGTPRVVPDVLAVQYYRRPNFELAVTGVPERVEKPAELTLGVTGRYYFGKPVGGGSVHVRLVRADEWQPLAEAAGTLAADGRVELRLAVPARLTAQRYFVLTSLTDDSGRTVSNSKPYEVRATGAADAPRLAAPRFAAAGEAFDVRSSGEKVTVDGETGIEMRDGRARITLKQVGWHTLAAAGEETKIFIYGGKEHPQWGELRGAEQEEQSRPARRAPGKIPQSREPECTWVNLTNYEWQEEQRYNRVGRWEDEGAELLGMFEGHHTSIGGKLRLLVYVPHKKARLLLTLEGETIVDYQLATVDGVESFYHVVEIPVPERYLPNFYVQGRVLAWTGSELELRKNQIEKIVEEATEQDQETEDPRWCRVDVLDPQAKTAQPKLKVEVAADRSQYRPGEEVRARIKVTDLAGKPAAAEVSLAVVDESVYSFGEDNLDDLPRAFASFHAPRSFVPKAWRSFRSGLWTDEGQRALAQLQAAQRESVDQLAAQLKRVEELAKLRKAISSQLSTQAPRPRHDRPVRPQGEMPASSIPLVKLRADFRETATWQPQLRVGADGTVDTAFKLPDSLTAYRLSAVALTRDTEIGVGRSSLKVSQPLSVQVMIPRFAVERDRLLAVGLIHNAAAEPRECQLNWEVSGAKVDGHDGPAANVKQKQADGTTTTGMIVTVPAGGTARVGMWLVMDGVGTVRVSLAASAGDERDAEMRTLEVQTSGRPREVYFSGTLRGHQAIKLPPGFVPADLRVSLARSDVARSLDSLAYLVDFPYGCVEQTMSRFLPAVAVKHATQQTPVELPPDVAAKLPQVLQQGLTRLYNFQHADGGWGWYEHDATNTQMTVYVVYGLARCRITGTKVDNEVLARGCAYLHEQIRKGTMSGHQGGLTPDRGRPSGYDLAPRAFLALALAGKAPRGDLESAASDATKKPGGDQVHCYLALACKEAGLPGYAAKLWQRARAWDPQQNTENLALKLTCQLTFGESLSDCHATGQRLLARRQGDRWENTNATAWAVQALAGLLSYGVPEAGPRRLIVTVDGKAVLEPRQPAEIDQLVHRVALKAGEFPVRDGLEITMSVDGKDPFAYTVCSSGIQRLEKFERTGTNLRMARSFTMVDGTAPPEAIEVGQVLAVHLDVEISDRQDYVMVEDLRPAGFEFASDRLIVEGGIKPAHVEFRDDRVVAFFTQFHPGRRRLTYYLRAETKGVSHVLPGRIYPMYNETLRGETGGGELRVK